MGEGRLIEKKEIGKSVRHLIGMANGQPFAVAGLWLSWNEPDGSTALSYTMITQRPRDIPEDVLSQMGMFIVHRLINERDRNIVEKACGDLDASAAAFLPTVGQGEAMVVGVNSPLPLPVAINRPARPPSSRSADYENLWG